jgi:hypothetical protein
MSKGQVYRTLAAASQKPKNWFWPVTSGPEKTMKLSLTLNYSSKSLNNLA